MLKPICIKCHFFMRPVRNGIYVLEMAGETPYKLWAADILGCPVCGRTIVTGFAQEPTAEHFEKRMYEVILNGCFNAAPDVRIPIILAYSSLDNQDHYESLKPNSMVWLKEYCERMYEYYS